MESRCCKADLQLQPGVSTDDVPPDVVFAHCAKQLAAFKVPRYLAYVDDLPMTASNDKVAKTQLTDGVDDLRAGAFDRAEQRWLRT